MSISISTPDVRAAGGWYERPDPPKDTPVRTSCPGLGSYRAWEITYHRDGNGNVTVEHSLAVDPVTRGRAEATAHQRSRIERVRARLAKRLAAKAPCDGCENGECSCEGMNGWKVGGSATSRVCSVCSKPTSCGTYNADGWVCDGCGDE
jgi:hypothetical protein